MNDRVPHSSETQSIRMADCHMHTPLCGHAIGEPQEYVDAALAEKFDLITFTCHVPMKHAGFGGQNMRMPREQISVYREKIKAAREYGAERGIEVLYGIEAEYFPEEHYLRDMDILLDEEPLDFVLGSLHAALPIFREWLQTHNCDSNESIVRAYFEQLINAIHSKRYDSLSHPDVIRLYGVLPEPFQPQKHESIIREFLKEARIHDQCLEINTSGLIKGDYVVHPDPIILKWASENGNRFTLGSDAHQPSSVGQGFKMITHRLLHDHGIRKLVYFKQRNPMEWSFASE